MLSALGSRFQGGFALFARQWRRGGGAMIVAGAIKVGAAAMSFIMLLAIAQLTGPKAFGLYALAFSAATLLAVVGAFGQKRLIQKRAPVYADAKGEVSYRSFLAWSGSAVGVGVSLAAALASAYVAFAVGGSIGLAAATASLTIFLIVTDWFQALLQARGETLWAMIPRELVWRLSVIVSCGVWAVGLNGHVGGAVTAAEAMAFAALPLGAIAALMARRFFHGVAFGAERSAAAVDARRTWLRESLAFCGISTLNTALAPASVMIVGGVMSAEDAGAYFAASRIGALLALPLTAANLVASPLIARRAAAGHQRGAQHLCRLNLAIANTLATTGAVFMIGFGSWILGTFGDGYAQAYPALVVLCAAGVANASFGPTAAAMAMWGGERAMFVYLGWTQGGALIAVALGAAQYGTLGAAGATFAATLVWNLLGWRWLRRRRGLDTAVTSLLRGRFVD